MKMKKGIVVIDMQNDFVDGVLGTKEAQAIVPNVVKFLDETVFSDIMVTMDTHYENYMETLEGKKLPVRHCIYGSNGWLINNEVHKALQRIPLRYSEFTKSTFGSIALAEYIREEKFDEIIIMGLCTSICVVSNALLIRAYCPDIYIKVKADCCACVTPESHDAALKTMQMCQIDVI